MRTIMTLLLAWCLFPTGMAWGQKDVETAGPVGIFSSRAQYNQFMGSAKQAAYGSGGNPELQAMIPMLNDIALNKPVGWTANEYGTSGSTLGLLSNEAIRTELEMVDSQYKELQELSAQIQQRAAKQIRSLDFSDPDNLAAEIQQIRRQATEDLNAVLLPHQLDRLKQIRMQSLLRRRSLVDVLTSDPVKSELNVTDQQSNELRNFEREVQEDLEKQIAKLRKQARERLLSKLDPEQKRQAQEMIGDAFVFDSKTGKKTEKSNASAKSKASLKKTQPLSWRKK